jgi:hypothetical protein
MGLAFTRSVACDCRYVISGDIAAALVELERSVGLLFTPIEDATFGYWLSPLALRHIDHPRIYAWGQHCCFYKSKLPTGEQSRGHEDCLPGAVAQLWMNPVESHQLCVKHNTVCSQSMVSGALRMTL